jgi:catechol 2,3-dioxygenase
MAAPHTARSPESHASRTLTRTATSHLGLRVPDVPACRDFYTRVVGLQVHEDLAGGGVRLGWGAGHHVLDLLPGQATGLDHFAFEVGAPGGPRELRRRLSAAGVETAALDPAAVGADGFEVTDPDGNHVQFHGPVDRSGEHGGAGAQRPIRFQHITIASNDLPPMLTFYVDVVGFRQSDAMGDEFAWLRSNRDHHTFAIVRGERGAELDHYSYDVSGWHDMKSWCDRLVDEDVQVTWGPGRHGPGNNLFVFFDDPAGNHIELSAEMERFHDDRVEYPVRRWEPVPGSINLWGGQLPAYRTTSKGG